MATKISHLFVLALAGSAAFVAASRFSAPESEVEVVEPTRPVPDSRPASPSTTGPTLQIRRDPIATEGTGDAFRTAAWTPPPAPPPPPAAPVAVPPPPPPTAPPLPFSFVGLLEQKSSRPTAFLAKGEALVIAGVGDVIDGAYRVESLSPAGVVVTYLPLNQRQTLGPSGGTP
jgi:hypothetical protein